MEERKKLGFFPMFASILAGMIGSGVYDLSYQLGLVASPGAVIIAWAVCFIGMLTFTLSLMNLLNKEPEGDGLYVYANKAAGPLGEFMSAWGYWMSGWIGNIAFATMMMIALSTFFPVLGDTGTSWPAIIVASVIMWALFFFINRGVESAMIINSILTVIKVIPLVLFFVVVVVSFNFGVFTTDFWTNFAGNVTHGGFDAQSVFDQVTNSIMSLVWVFMGIETAALMSRRAQSKSIAASASITGLACGTILMFIISILPYGVMTADEFVALGEPSVARMLELYIGPIGGHLISAAMVISILGAWINYTLGPTESLLILSDHGLLPKKFGELNDRGVPTFSLFLTTLLGNLLLISMHFTEDAYNFGYSLSASAILITWVFITIYQVKRGIQHPDDPGRVKNLVIGVIGCVYFFYAMFVSGISYILLCGVLYVVGFFFYYKARKDEGMEAAFNGREKLAVAAVAVAAVVGLVMYVMGM
ncbi:amino acid permease [uncultured Enorma sp.]|uniref:amino acid permease n=1 Tax=uncultured Enorma sp. TaxID=1714346 RepID=UPI0026184DD4|nr:amino acid permease [uncultured Enorma sp.]